VSRVNDERIATLVEAGETLRIVGPGAWDGMEAQHLLLDLRDARADATEAARMAAETIAAQQAEIRRLEEEVVRERERCAGVCEKCATEFVGCGTSKMLDMASAAARDCAAAIRRAPPSGSTPSTGETLSPTMANLLVAASAAYDYFSDKTDADLVDGSFRGNREASLASELAEAIRKAKGTRP